MFRVNQSLLRFWETVFSILQPKKNKKGDRYFRPVDIKNLHLIYHLLRQRKYTIEGAKEFLRKNKTADQRFEAIQRLQQIKAFLLELKAQGRVKAIGAGMNQWQMELAFARQGHFDCFLLAGRYTLLDQTALPEFLPYCVEHGISVVAGGPYNSGILAVGPREGATFNYRAASPEMMDKARRVAAVCERHHVPLRAAALQFILAHPAIASVIPGARSVAEVEENVALVEHPIPAALWADLKQDGLIADAAPTPGAR